jgi:hypothetical protein
VSWPSYPDTSTSLAENLVIWHEGYGRPLYVPVYAANAPYVQNITYRNIVFIRSEHSYWAQSFIPIEGTGTKAKVRNLLYENITFEEIITPSGQANRGSFFVWTVSSGSSISNVTFRNLRTPLTSGTLTGASATENISNITFENVFRNGEKMTSLAQMGVTTNEHVTGIVVK